MIGALLRARRQRTINYLRYHLDAGTLIRLALMAGFLLLLSGGPLAAQEGLFHRMRQPGFGAGWFRVTLWLLPILAVFFLQQARAVRRPSREAHLLFVSGAATAGMERWAALRQLERSLFLILLASLPAAMPDGTAAPVLRGASLLVGLTVLSLGALQLTSNSRQALEVPRVAPRRLSSALIRGGPLQGIVARDLVYLARRSPGTFVLIGAAAVIEFLVARSMILRDSSPAALIVTHVIAGALVVNVLMNLFERDAAHAGLLRALPIAGRRFWLARVLLAWALAVLPAVPGIILAGLSGKLSPPIVVGLATLSLPLAVLYANVGVALFPRITLAGFFLNMTVVLLLVSWLLTPLATLAVGALTLGLWSLRAPRAFDNWEAA